MMLSAALEIKTRFISAGNMLSDDSAEAAVVGGRHHITGGAHKNGSLGFIF